MGGKKFGTNSKSEEARSKKAEVKRNENEKKQKDKEDKMWEETDTKILDKQKKQKEKEDKAREDAKKKQEAKELLQQEDKEIKDRYGKPSDTKVTRFEIQQKREKEQKQREKELASRPSDPRVVVVPTTTTTTTTTTTSNKSGSDDEEEDFNLEENMNHILREQRLKDGKDVIDARDINEAIGALSGNDGKEQHPERRMKAAFNAYEEENLPVLRKENPSLRLTQVKQLLWKNWLKAPENPFNQVGSQ
ncbi:hypothetical protein ACTFIY_001504 [Dictyostelium cf. discoideum]